MSTDNKKNQHFGKRAACMALSAVMAASIAAVPAAALEFPPDYGGYRSSVERTLDGVSMAQTYNVYVGATSGGSITQSNGNNPVNAGSSLEIKFQPNVGYVFDKIEVDGIGVSPDLITDNTYTLTDINGPANVMVYFKLAPKATFNITAVVDGNTGGTISGPASVTQGTNATYTFAPSAGYIVSAVYVDEVQVTTANSYTFTNVQSDHSLRVVFAKDPAASIQVSASTDGNGTISPSGTTYVTSGANVTYTFTPAYGYVVDAVYVNGQKVSTSGSSYTIYNVRQNSTIHVTFVRGSATKHTIHASTDRNGSISPSGYTNVSRGDSMTYRFYPASGYQVAAIYVDNQRLSYVADYYTFTSVDRDHTIFVEFEPSYSSVYRTIRVESSYGGYVSPEGNVNVAYGTDKTFRFYPNSGYEVAGVYVDGEYVGCGNSYTLYDVRSAHTIYVDFEETGYGTRYDIDVTYSSGGRVSPNGTVRVTRGYDKRFDFTPNSGYYVSAIYVDGVRLNYTANYYTFANVREDHTLRVEFSRFSTPSTPSVSYYSITASAGTGGSISPSGTTSVTKGSSKTYTITPNTNYAISAIYVDGEKINSTSTRYTFSNVNANHSIQVEFVKLNNEFTIHASAGANGRISPSGNSVVKRGNNKTYSFSPNSGYVVKAVYVDDVYVGDSSSYIIKNVNADHDIYVVFEKRAEAKSRYTIDINCGENGTASIKTGTSVAKGDDKTISFFPREGYKLASVRVNGLPVDIKDNSITLKTVLEDYTVEAQFARHGLGLVYPANWTNPFSDVKASDWFFESVRYMNGNGLIQGTSATTYSPNATTTRGMVIQILYRLDGAPSVGVGNQFSDVHANAYYAEAINWAARSNVISSYDCNGNQFRPDDAITREELANLLFNFAQYRGFDTSARGGIAAKFADVDSVSGFAYNALDWANAMGFVNGTSTTTLAPQGFATRSQAGTMLTRFCMRFAEGQ